MSPVVKKRKIKRFVPATMATQHPDNASAPFWKKDSDGFINVQEEIAECVFCFKDLGVAEFMWDWEGKHADESVIDKLFSHHYEFFKKNHIGKNKFLTFRLPNVWQEKGYSLARALMVILTSEDFAHDLNFYRPPLFEVILPMTERAEQLIYIQKSFQKLARFKFKTFAHQANSNTDYIEIIPLVEGVDNQLHISRLLHEYILLHSKYFKIKPLYIRPFLARSDPALVSGLVATVLANKVALSDINIFSREQNIPTFPIIGAGSLVFRGGLNPLNIKNFIKEYGGVRTVTIQSGFRYDYPLSTVKKSINYLDKHLSRTQAEIIKLDERSKIIKIINKFSRQYQNTVAGLVNSLEFYFQLVPKRRERRQHIGLLAYKRKMGRHSLPRAINFTAALYSLGVPPEFLGLGRALAKLSRPEHALLLKYYHNFKSDSVSAGKYLNIANIKKMAKRSPAWSLVLQDVELTEKILGINLGPKTKDDLLYQKLTSKLLDSRNKKTVAKLIASTGKLRRSLG